MSSQGEELGLLKKQKEEVEQARRELEQSLVDMEGDLEKEKTTSLALKEGKMYWDHTLSHIYISYIYCSLSYISLPHLQLQN